jgi:hypothetical protein
MKDAYRAARDLIEEKSSRSERELIADLSSSEVVVVRGKFDRVEQILEPAGMPFKLIDPQDLDRLDLDPLQMVVINCPGKLSDQAIQNVRTFVVDGGSLFTTDWALNNVVEKAFPGVIEFNDHPTPDAVVPVHINNNDNPLLEGVFEKGSDPQWWLETGSYPIRVLDHDRVNVLVESRELASKWGEKSVVVNFEYGRGEVLHMISHYYLQRTELRSDRHKEKWTSYAREVGAVRSAAANREEFSHLSTGEVESAYTSMRMTQNAVLSKARKTREFLDSEPAAESTDDDGGTKKGRKKK